MVALPLRAGHSQLCAHDTAGRLRPGKGQTDGFGLVPLPAELGPGTLFDLGAGLGIGVAHGAEVVDLLRAWHLLEPGFQQSTSGGIAAGQQAVMGFQRLNGGSRQTGIPCPIHICTEAAAQALGRFLQPRGRVCMDSQQRLCAPALPLGLCPPLGRKPRHRSCQPSLRRTVQAQHTAGLLCQIPSTPYYDVSRTKALSSAASAASSDCRAAVRACVPSGTLPCASRRPSSSAACAARARTSARSGRETKSFLT